LWFSAVRVHIFVVFCLLADAVVCELYLMMSVPEDHAVATLGSGLTFLCLLEMASELCVGEKKAYECDKRQKCCTVSFFGV